jgi:hypothetical protein
MRSIFQTFILAGIMLFCLVIVWFAPSKVFAQPPAQIIVGDFSASEEGNQPPDEWEVLLFDKIPEHTRYESVKDEGNVVIRAQSQSSASGLVRRIEIDPRQYPIIEWRWKVDGILKNGDARTKAGDDYAARIYLTFRYDPSLLSFGERVKYKTVKLLRGEYPPSAVLNYIWANKVPINTFIPSPYTRRSMMVAVQSGEGQARQWIREERNILLDFREAFKTEPPTITGVAIMTDSDNTGESATAWYGDIVFRKK